MKFVTPGVFLIYKSEPQKEAIQKWLTFIGADQYTINWDAVTAGEQLVQLAGKRCYMSFQLGLNPNIQRIRTDMTDFIDNILKVGHGSVLEHVSYTFAIENVSRVLTGEMNRHRAGVAISEGSMRFIRYNDIPMVDVPSIWAEEGDSPEVRVSKDRTRVIFAQTAQKIEEAYKHLQDIWKGVLEGPDFKDKKHVTSMMRRIIPMGIATGGLWTFNLRALRHVFTMRCAEAAEEEILRIACMMLEQMIETEPVFFKDFHKNEQGFWEPTYRKV